jgi:hypothetical protein
MEEIRKILITFETESKHTYGIGHQKVLTDTTTKILKAIEGKLLTELEIMEILENHKQHSNSVKAVAIRVTQTAKMFPKRKEKPC